jgi:hypothetical protein
MFYSCPHCRELVATDPATREPPERCPRCGGSLRPDASGITATPAAARPETPPIAARSLATFLQPKVDPSDAALPSAPATEPPAEPLAQPASPPDAIAGTSQDAAAQPLATDATTDEPQTMSVDSADVIDDASAAAPDLQPASPVAGEPEPAADEGNSPTADINPAETDAGPLAIAADASPAPEEPATAVPAFTRAPRAPAAHTRIAAWQWIAMIVLSLGLMLQVLVADRARLAADPAWRPLVAGVCGALGCSVPPWRQPAAFTMLSRDVRPMPGAPGALRVQATFRNDARWAQPWPALLISLSDADGRVVGARVFTAAEYVDAAATQEDLAPGQSARIVLQLREPDAAVVAFSFDFR